MILLVGCAGQADKSDNMYKEQLKESKTNRNFIKKKVDVKNFKKEVSKIKYDKNIQSDIREKKDNKISISSKFTSISYQKLQQLFDVVCLINNKETKQEMKEYAEKHAEKLFLKTKDYKKIKLNNLIKHSDADSLRIQNIKLIKMEKSKDDIEIGNYSFIINAYKNGKIVKKYHKKAKLYFEITILELEDNTYKTIKAKILSLE
jgi:3-dehydroquinate synthase class II